MVPLDVQLDPGIGLKIQQFVQEKAAEVDKGRSYISCKMQQLELENQAAIVDYAKAQAEESRARAAKYLGEAEALPEEIEIKKIDAITKNLQPGLEDDQEFTKRLQIADVALRERGLDIQQEGMRQPTGPAAAPMAPEAPPMAMPPQGLPPGVA